jgi:hypothetical protein
MHFSQPKASAPAILRLVVIVAMFGTAAAIFHTSHHLPLLPAGEYYTASRQQIMQADLTFRLSLFLEVWGGAGDAGALRPAARSLQERAVAEYERLALDTSPNPLALHRLGIIYGSRDYARQAEQVLVRAAARDEEKASLYFALASLYGPQTLPPRYNEQTYERLADQPQWLADIVLPHYLQLTGRELMAGEVKAQALRRTQSFGWRLLGLLLAYGLLGLAGLVIVLRAIVKQLFYIPEESYQLPGLNVPWEPLDALEVAGVMYFTLALLSIGVSLLWQQPGLLVASVWLRVVILVAQYLLLAGVTLAVIWERSAGAGRHRLVALGARQGKPWALIGSGLGGYGVLICLLVASGALFYGIMTFGAVSTARTGESLVASINDPLALGVLFLLICVVAPLVEETIFRGFVYAGLRRRLPLVPSVVGSAALFALLHANPEAMLPITLIGVVLAILYERTRSLWPCIICHALNNTLVFLLMMLTR